MTAQTILWIYIGLMIGGGIMGLIKGGSKASLITSVVFAIPLILCEFDVLPFRFATWILLILLVVFAWRLSQSRKFMPMGLLLVLTLAALAGLWSQSKRWPGGPRLGLVQPIPWSFEVSTIPESRTGGFEPERRALLGTAHASMNLPSNRGAPKVGSWEGSDASEPKIQERLNAACWKAFCATFPASPPWPSHPPYGGFHFSTIPSTATS